MCWGGGSFFPPLTQGGGDQEGKVSLAGIAGKLAAPCHFPEPASLLSLSTHPLVLPGPWVVPCSTPPWAMTPSVGADQPGQLAWAETLWMGRPGGSEGKGG